MATSSSPYVLPHEYDGVYDPDHPMSRACWNLIESVSSYRVQFLQWKQAADQFRELAESRLVDVRRDAVVDATKRHKRASVYSAQVVKRPDFIRAKWDASTMAVASSSYPSLLMLGLVAALDAFEAELMRAAFKVKPQLLRASRRSLDWAEIDDLVDKEAMRGLVIEKEISDVLHENRSVQLKRLGQIFGMTESEVPTSPALLEVVERRNLYAHESGRVSAHYRHQCFDDLAVAPEVGTHLTTDVEYFNHACDEVMLFGIRLTQLAWRRLARDQIGAADRDLSQLAYEILALEDWKLAQAALGFAVNLTHSSEMHRMIFRVNHAQTFKWQGNQRACVAVLEQEQWDSKDKVMKMARAVLLDDFDLAATLMKDAVNTSEIDRAALEHWPLFRVFRTSRQYERTAAKLPAWGRVPKQRPPAGSADAVAVS